MRIRYRYVPYGTHFIRKEGPRPLDNSATAADLHQNEVAADVGQAWWGDNLAVIDHHFAAESQFPSASAAVLHAADKVNAWWSEVKKAGFEDVWLVTHENPDFDALAALYLIRNCADWTLPAAASLGIAPDAWRALRDDEVPGGRPRIDWYSGPAESIGNETRWRLSLAVTASMTDQCRRFECARTHSAPAVFYAALARRRDFKADGAIPFFSEFRAAIAEGRKNPVTDAIFEADGEFSAELALLKDDEFKYARDVKKAYRTILAIPQYIGHFAQYYEKRTDTALLDGEGRLDPIHTETGVAPSTTDAIFIRDPESVLFRDWARMDSEIPSTKQGFLFTAVAYSDKTRSRVNNSAYYFALNPETAASRTLYPVWARLEAAEINALQAAGPHSPRPPRHNFEKRAGPLDGLLADPWFDGSNYRTTIVVTPSDGTSIGPAGTAGDLSDDPVANIVREALTIYAAPPKTVCYRSGKPDPDQPDEEPDYRLGSIALRPGLDLSSDSLIYQTAEHLWQLLNPGSRGVPTDFRERHLVQNPGSIEVWSRAGVAFAVFDDKAGRARLERLTEQFGSIVNLLFSAGEPKNTKQDELQATESLLKEISRVRQELAMARGSVAIRRFVDAVGFHDTLATTREMLAAQRAHQIATSTEAVLTSLEEGQKKVELLETLIVTLYAVEMGHIILDALANGGWLEVVILSMVGLAVVGVVWSGVLRRKAFRTLSLVPLLTVLLLLGGLIAASVPEIREYVKQKLSHAEAPRITGSAPDSGEKNRSTTAP